MPPTGGVLDGTRVLAIVGLLVSGGVAQHALVDQELDAILFSPQRIARNMRFLISTIFF
jgi:hypothetical protein